MDEQNLRDLQALPSRTDTAELIVMWAYIPSDAPPDIQNQYHKRDFVEALKLVQRVVNNMIWQTGRITLGNKLKTPKFFFENY